MLHHYLSLLSMHVMLLLAKGRHTEELNQMQVSCIILLMIESLVTTFPTKLIALTVDQYLQ